MIFFFFLIKKVVACFRCQCWTLLTIKRSESDSLRFGSPDMMGHPELVKEVEKEELGPLISLEGLEQLQNKYVQSVRVSRHGGDL